MIQYCVVKAMTITLATYALCERVASGDPGSLWQESKLVASDATEADEFGYSVGASGYIAVIGAVSDDGPNGVNQGSAYVFVRGPTAWNEQAKLTAADGASFDQFGYSVAISGDTVVIGARDDDGSAGIDQGSAYVFVRNGAAWSQQAKLLASDGVARAEFGRAVAIDTDTIVVGAPFATDALGYISGAAYVFTRSGGEWIWQAKLVASDAQPPDHFGFSVATAGGVVVVGAPKADFGVRGFDQGAAYIFVLKDGAWSEQSKLTVADAASSDEFGHSVAISGESVVSGAWRKGGEAGAEQGAAFVFARVGTVWNQQAVLRASGAAAGYRFGASVAIGGQTVTVGSPYSHYSPGVSVGSASVFCRSNGVWSEQATLKAADDLGRGFFGCSVSLSNGGLVVGAYDADGTSGSFQGSAYIFRRRALPLADPSSLRD